LLSTFVQKSSKSADEVYTRTDNVHLKYFSDYASACQKRTFGPFGKLCLTH